MHCQSFRVFLRAVRTIILTGMLPEISTYLDFLIALVFNLAIGSIILSLLFEFFAYFLKRRANFLYKLIYDVLNDKLNYNYAAKFYENPQIDLTKRTYRHKPAYISSINFAQTLINTIVNMHETQNEKFEHKEGDVFFKKEQISAEITERFRSAVNNMNFSDLKILLTSFLNTAESEKKDLIENICQWYDEYMNRAAGWYKMKSQRMMVIMAIIGCVAFNIDIFRVSNTLLHDKELASLIAGVAETYVEENKEKTKQLNDNYPDLSDQERFEQHQKDLQEYLTIVDHLYAGNAPIGWKGEVIPDSFSIAYLLKKIAGWLIMAFALAFGAPFWFDLLGKLVNIRKSGLKPLTHNVKT